GIKPLTEQASRHMRQHDRYAYHLRAAEWQPEPAVAGEGSLEGSRVTHGNWCNTCSNAQVPRSARNDTAYDFPPRSISSISYPSGASTKAILPMPLGCGPSDNG